MHYMETHNGREVVVDEHDNLVSNASMRKAMYQIMFTYLKFGHLRKGVRIPIPALYRRQRKDTPCNGEFMGFHTNAEENT